MGTRLAALAIAIAASACSTTAAPDASTVDSGGSTDAAVPDLDVEPVPPLLTPCPPGWREVTAVDGVTTCDPWPETGYDAHCAFDEAHVPGTPGCARVGTACASDGWPSDLPAGYPVVYVDDDAAPGGDGSTRARAFRTLAAGLTVAHNGQVVAVATGHYDEQVTVGGGVILWGACVSGTRVTSSTPSPGQAVIEMSFGYAGMRNLGIDSPVTRGVQTLGQYVTLDDVVVSGATEFGIYVAEQSATLTGVVVRDGRALPDGTAGDGLAVGSGATAIVRRTVLERNTFAGAEVESAGSQLELDDSAIEGTLSEVMSGEDGHGVEVDDGGAAVLNRVAVERNRDVGIFADGAGTTLQATDVVVRGTLGETSDGMGGDGVDGNHGAAITLSRTWITNNLEVGLITGTGVTIGASDLVVENTVSDAATGLLGRGIDIEHGAVLTLARAKLSHDSDMALFASDPGTQIHATDVTITDTQPQAADGQAGSGVWVQLSAAVDLTTARIERSRFVGVLAGAGGVVTLSDVVVSGVTASACGATTCPDYAGGFGFSAHYGGALTATGFQIDGAALCGVLVGQSRTAQTAMDLNDGVIDGAPVGACVQVDGYDTSRLNHDVEYRGVVVPLQATSYTLPDAVPTGG